MTTVLLGATLLLVVGVLAAYAQRVDGIFSPVTIVGISLVLYVVAIPVEVSLTGHRELVLDALVPVPQAVTDAVVPLAFLALLAFTGGYLVLAHRRDEQPGAVPAALTRDDVAVALRGIGTTAMLAVAAMVLMFGPSLIAMRDYESAYTERYSSPVFALGLTLTQFLVAMYGQARARFGPHGLRDAVLFTLGLLAWGLYSNQKTPLVLAGLVLLGYLLRRVRRVPGVLMVAVVVLAPAAMGVAAFSFSTFRGGGTFDLSARTHFLTSIEPAGPFLSIVDEMTLRGSTAPSSGFGESVLNALVGWIPQSVWPQRPLDLAEQFARARVPDWQPGEGYGYSPFAEALHQGGAAGVAAYFFVLGLGIALLRNLLTQWRTPSPHRLVSETFYYVVVAYLLFTLFRGPFASSVTTLAHASAIYLAVMVATSLAPRPLPVPQTEARRHECASST